MQQQQLNKAKTVLFYMEFYKNWKYNKMNSPSASTVLFTILAEFQVGTENFNKNEY